MMDQDRIVEGLARAMWTEAHDAEPRIDWAEEYDWVREKWLRYARVAVSFLAAQDLGTSAQSGRQTWPTTTNSAP
jgi:hypothetical protein